MHIDRQLNLIIELDRGSDTPPVFVHSTALPTEIFESYFDICGPAMNALITGGYGYFAPRYAALVLRQVARRWIPAGLSKDDEAYRKAEASVVERITAFYNELHRLTSVIALKDAKWDTVLIEDARNLNAITAEEYSRIDATLTFFTCSWQSVPPEDRESIVGGLSAFHARTESLSCTEFVHSLQTSMKAGNSGAKAAASPASLPGSQATQASGSTSNGSTSPASPGAHPRHTGIGITLQPPQA